MHYDYVALGGGVAGGYCVDAIRQRDPEGSIALLTAEGYRPYNRPPLSKEILLDLQTPEQAYLHPPEYYAQQRIDLRTNTRVTRVRPADRTLELADGSELRFEKLLYAPGAQARRLDLPGSDLQRVFLLRTLDDSLAIRAAMKESRSAVVIGGSFIGAEVASALAQQGVSTTMVFVEDRLFGRLLDPALSDDIGALFQDHGVRLLPGQKPARFEGEGTVSAVLTDRGERLPCDMVVLGVGVQLNVQLAQDAGLEMAGKGVACDRTLRSSHPQIYVAGDVAAYEDLIFGQGRLRVEHWDVALHQGMVAGANMAGADQPYDRLPYFFSLLFGLYIQEWGNLTGWDQVVARGRVAGGSFARFYFSHGVLNAVLAAGWPRDDLETAQRWIRARKTMDQVGQVLANEEIPLATAAVPA